MRADAEHKLGIAIALYCCNDDAMALPPQVADSPPILLVPGYWLGAWAWDQVIEHLSAAGFRATALTLPGLNNDDPGRASRTLDDQVTAIESTIAALGGNVVLVAHSGANTPVTVFLDQKPEQVRRIVWVDSAPAGLGKNLSTELPDAAEELPLPPFDVLGQQASLEGLTQEQLECFRDKAVPEPGSVVRASTNLTNDARKSVPTTLVCCSLAGSQVVELAQAQHPVFAEIAQLDDLSIVDLPTGHWPMWSRPKNLAEVIGDAACQAN